MGSLLDYDFGKLDQVNWILLAGICMVILYIVVAYLDPNAASGALSYLVVLGGLAIFLGAKRQKTGHKRI